MSASLSLNELTLDSRDGVWFNGGMKTTNTTHEQFIHLVRDIVTADALERGAIDKDEAERLGHAKLIYGVGNGARGTCYYGAWANGIGNVEIVEIAALTEESWVQLAGTTIHELAHVLAGHGAGHDKDWKAAAERLGFTKRPEAAGQVYRLAMMKPIVRLRVHDAAMALSDGNPSFQWVISGATPRPCGAGLGTRGGQSRGKGSGSRLRLYECFCAPKPIKVRVASDVFNATCDDCGVKFERKN